MARGREHTTAIIITGDGEGGVKAVRANKEELEKLGAEQKEGKKTTEDYGKAHKKTGEDVSRSSEIIKKGAKVAAAAVAALAAGLSALFKVRSAAIEQDVNTAQMLGISSEAYQAQAYAVQMLGIEKKKYGDILRDMTARVQKFAQLGSGRAKDFFESLNLDVQEFAALAPDELLRRIGQELEHLNQNERILFLRELGGGDAALLGNIITDLERLESEARAIGVALNEVDAQKVAMASESLEKATSVFTGASNQITAGLAPIVDDLASRFFNVAVEAGGIEGVVDRVVDATVAGVGFIADHVQRMQQLLKLWELGWTQIGAAGTSALADNAEAAASLINSGLQPITWLLSTIADGWASILELGDNALNPFRSQFRGAAESLRNFSGAVKDFTVDVDDIYRADEALQARIAKLRGELDDMMNAPPASEEIHEWYAELTRRAEELARAQLEANAAGNQSIAIRDGQIDAATQLIENMQFENSLLSMGNLERQIEVNLRRLGTDATEEQIEAVRRLTIERYNHEQAMKRSAETAKATGQVHINQIENIQRAWGEMLYNMDLSASGVFDSILDGFRRMLAEMASADAVNVVLNGGGVRSLASGNVVQGMAGMASLVARVPGGERFMGNLGLPNAAVPGGDYTVSGEMATGFNATQFAQSLGAGIAGHFAGDRLGEALFGKEAQSNFGSAAGAAIGTYLGGPIGTFIGSGIGSMLDVAFGGDGKQRMNAGMFVAGTHDLNDPRVFAVDRFASGFAPTGYARRADQDMAKQVIDVFRSVDAEFTKMIRELGGTIDLTVATLAGLDEEARPGSRGTFLGLGGLSELTGDIDQQIGMFVDGLINHVGGLEESLIAAMRAAGSVDEVFRLLSQELGEHEQLVADNTYKLERMRRMEERLMRERIDGISSLVGEWESIQRMRQSIGMQMAGLMGATPLFDIQYSVSEQIRAIEEQRALLIRNHDEQIRAEMRLHETRMAAANDLIRAADALRFSSFSPLSARAQFELARQNFRDLFAAAETGDVEAAQQLQEAARVYAENSQNMFASSAEHKQVMDEILNGMEHVADIVRPSAEFDPTAANQALVEGLRQLDDQLAAIAAGVNTTIVDKLSEINVTLRDMSPQMQSALLGAIEQYIMAGASGEDLLEALGGIRASVDYLPPEIGAIMVAAMSTMLLEIHRTGGSGQRTTEGMPSGSLPHSAAEQALIDAGFNLDFAADEITDHVRALEAQMGHTHEFIRQVYAEAVAAGIGSLQLADVLGYSQADIHQALRDSGIDPTGFRDGGIARGPDSGHLQVLHGTEAVVPLPNGRSIPVQINDQGSKAVVVELQALRAEVSELRRLTMTKGEVDNDNDRRAIAALESMDSKLEADRGVGSRRYGHAS